jgi:hypothetical protein
VSDYQLLKMDYGRHNTGTEGRQAGSQGGMKLNGASKQIH